MRNFSLKFEQSLLDDFVYIYQSILDFSGSKTEADYVVKSIKSAIFQLENPYLPGILPYSHRIARKGFLQFFVFNGIYVVFFKEDREKMEREIFYVKNTKTNYFNSV